MMLAGVEPTTGSHGAPVDDAMLDVCRERRCRSAERPVSLSERQAATGTEASLFASRHRAGSAHSVPADPSIHPPLLDKQAASPPLDSLPQHAHRLVSPVDSHNNTGRQRQQHRIGDSHQTQRPRHHQSVRRHQHPGRRRRRGRRHHHRCQSGRSRRADARRRLADHVLRRAVFHRVVVRRPLDVRCARPGADHSLVQVGPLVHVDRHCRSGWLAANIGQERGQERSGAVDGGQTAAPRLRVQIGAVGLLSAEQVGVALAQKRRSQIVPFRSCGLFLADVLLDGVLRFRFGANLLLLGRRACYR